MNNEYNKFCYALCQLTKLIASAMMCFLAVGEVLEFAELTITKLCVMVGMYVYADLRANTIQKKFNAQNRKAKSIEVHRRAS